MIKPLKERVLIKKLEEEQVTSSGIEVVQYAKTAKSSTVSTGVIEASTTLTLGATVLFDEGWGNEIEPGMYLVKEEAVLAYVD